jgi:membrane protein implicated in regulation of membrane protease activity
MRQVIGPYFLAQVPGWILAAIVLWALQHWGALTPAYAAGLLLLWIVKDVLLFPVMRRFYEPEPAGKGLIGEGGTAVTALAPDGLVRVQGVLWRARSEQEIPAGAAVRVRDVDGLTLLVVPHTPPASAG